MNKEQPWGKFENERKGTNEIRKQDETGIQQYEWQKRESNGVAADNRDSLRVNMTRG